MQLVLLQFVLMQSLGCWSQANGVAAFLTTLALFFGTWRCALCSLSVMRCGPELTEPPQ
jgi:hypothetical protein